MLLLTLHKKILCPIELKDIDFFTHSITLYVPKEMVSYLVDHGSRDLTKAAGMLSYQIPEGLAVYKGDPEDEPSTWNLQFELVETMFTPPYDTYPGTEYYMMTLRSFFVADKYSIYTASRNKYIIAPVSICNF